MPKLTYDDSLNAITEGLRAAEAVLKPLGYDRLVEGLHEAVSDQRGAMREALAAENRVQATRETLQRAGYNPEYVRQRVEEARVQARQARQAAEQRCHVAAQVAQSIGRQVVAAVDGARLPRGLDLSDSERARAVDELRMVLDAVTDGEELMGAMHQLIRECGPNSAEARLLLGSWGERYCRAREGKQIAEATVSALRSQVAAEAGEHGDDRQRAAAKALDQLDEVGFMGNVNSLQMISSTFADCGFVETNDGGESGMAQWPGLAAAMEGDGPIRVTGGAGD